LSLIAHDPEAVKALVRRMRDADAERRADYLSKAPEIRLLEDAEAGNRLIRERIAKSGSPKPVGGPRFFAQSPRLARDLRETPKAGDGDEDFWRGTNSTTTSESTVVWN
jgi:hypothetical protein